MKNRIHRTLRNAIFKQSTLFNYVITPYSTDANVEQKYRHWSSSLRIKITKKHV